MLKSRPMRPSLAVILAITVLTSVWLGRRINDSVPFFHESTCEAIANTLSPASDVYYPGSPLYEKGISHWASSSVQLAQCSVEPGTAEDLAKILRIVGSRRTSFAVKGGGHSTNPGFSSTTGVHIAMNRFAEVTYNARTKSAIIGAGLIWDDVYAALEPYGISVVGGRVSGVGVAGFALGGGYSWKTNQYGLTIDNIIGYELVLPSGVVKNVTHESDPDLFFGLRGGFNNFGIVTRFTMRTHKQSEVWGGLILYSLFQTNAVNAANHRFSRDVKDPKASVIASYIFHNVPLVAQIIFYDGPKPPRGIFNDFLKIPSISKNVSTRSYLSLVQCSATASNVTKGTRQLFYTVPFLTHSLSLHDAIVNETVFWSAALPLPNKNFLSYTFEPFLPSILTHSSVPSAYPPSRSRAFFPLNIFYSWKPSSSDAAMRRAVEDSARRLKRLAQAEGQDVDDAPLYPNYALPDTPLEHMYGHNVPALRTLKSAVDPDNVMGLAGGFKF